MFYVYCVVYMEIHTIFISKRQSYNASTNVLPVCALSFDIPMCACILYAMYVYRVYGWWLLGECTMHKFRFFKSDEEKNEWKEIGKKLREKE